MEDNFIPFDFEEEYFEEPEEDNVQEHVQMDLVSRNLLIPLTISPWTPDGKKYSNNLLDMLHEEIDDYLSFIAPTKAEHFLRQVVVERVTAVARSLWPNAVIHVFGSFDTKLYLPSRYFIESFSENTSDIDIVILEPNLYTPSCLYHLKTALTASSIYSKIEVIDKAKVPIIKMVDALTNLNVDISFNVPGTSSSFFFKLLRWNRSSSNCQGFPIRYCLWWRRATLDVNS
jgi:non-canonical poly(A) RNA polymerase PAPD5/7